MPPEALEALIELGTLLREIYMELREDGWLLQDGKLINTREHEQTEGQQPKSIEGNNKR